MRFLARHEAFANGTLILSSSKDEGDCWIDFLSPQAGRGQVRGNMRRMIAAEPTLTPPSPWKGEGDSV